jgi:hypothetical protein
MVAQLGRCGGSTGMCGYSVKGGSLKEVVAQLARCGAFFEEGR